MAAGEVIALRHVTCRAPLSLSQLKESWPLARDRGIQFSPGFSRISRRKGQKPKRPLWLEAQSVALRDGTWPVSVSRPELGLSLD